MQQSAAAAEENSCYLLTPTGMAASSSSSSCSSCSSCKSSLARLDTPILDEHPCGFPVSNYTDSNIGIDFLFAVLPLNRDLGQHCSSIRLVGEEEVWSQPPLLHPHSVSPVLIMPIMPIMPKSIKEDKIPKYVWVEVDESG